MCTNVVISYTYSIKLSSPSVWLLGILYGVKKLSLYGDHAHPYVRFSI